jgi:hypothetical protein
MGGVIGRSQSRLARTKAQDPIQKITKAKKNEVLTQVVEGLPSKDKALSSNVRTLPVPPPKKKTFARHRAPGQR